MSMGKRKTKQSLSESVTATFQQRKRLPACVR